MHTLKVIAGGTILLGIFLVFGHLWSDAPRPLATAAAVFVPVWFLVSILNLWIGVSRAGYTLAEELPILLAVFAFPAALAALAGWHYAKI